MALCPLLPPLPPLSHGCHYALDMDHHAPGMSPSNLIYLPIPPPLPPGKMRGLPFLGYRVLWIMIDMLRYNHFSVIEMQEQASLP
jgi:hypothetical protein